jgi:hypothetical protein
MWRKEKRMDIRPIPTRATRGQPPTGPSSHPIGGAIGCLAAGIWSLAFAIWFKTPTWLDWILVVVGWFSIAVSLLFIGATIGDLLSKKNWRRDHGY